LILKRSTLLIIKSFNIEIIEKKMSDA
jgi:hypothetical protein